jgi:acetyl-CoA carboxylase biotin carboxyl carrier protein
MGVTCLEFDDIQKLMTGFEHSSTRELKIDDHGFHLYLSKNNQSAPVKVEKQVNADDENDAAEKPATDSNTGAIKAPLVGTVYLQPKPDQPAYVKVGDHVHKGDVVCVIEAMKMITEVKSDRDGVVKSIDVENGDLVEFNQSLFTISEGE